MAARIVYEGVRAGDGGGGTLFEGKIFHLLQRVPLSGHITDLIKANGGELTNLEKNADIVIGDHLRATPAGSVSYSFITDSVKHGKLEDTEEHLNSKKAAKIRSGGATAARPNQAQPLTAKVGRTPFTPADDEILMSWCIKWERKGGSILGNEAYKHLEAKYPHHTYQSWRDRWVKYVRHRSRPDEVLEREEEEKLPAQQSPVKRKLPSIKVPPPRGTPRAPAQPKTAPAASKSPEKLTRKDFTKKDIKLLMGEYDSIMGLDEEQVIDAWMTWAEFYPWHTAQEWRNYFNKNLSGKRKASPQKDPESQVPSSPPTPISRPQKSQKAAIEKPGPSPRRSPRQSNLTTTRQENRKVPATVQEVKDSQGSSNRTISSIDAQKSPKAADEGDERERNFNENMRLAVQSWYPDCEVELEPTILGKQIKLYDLWNAVLSEEFIGVNELDDHEQWHEVAEVLGFEEGIREKAGQELRLCYDEFLARLREEMENYDEPSASQTDEMVAEQLLQTASEAAHRDDVDAEEGGDDDLGAPQYSPFVKSTKRPSPIDFTPTKSKRQRTGRRSGSREGVLEIPSTPDEELQSFHQLQAAGSSRLNEGERGSGSGRNSARIEEELWEQPSKSPSPSKSRTLPIHSASTSQSQKRGSLGSKRSTPRRHSGHSETASSTQSHNNSTQSQLGQFIQTCLGLGYSHDIIDRALHSTCLTVGGRSTHVMEALFAGRKIPEETAGVWTDADDEDLALWVADKNGKLKGKGLEKDKGKGKAAYRRLVEKHTRDGVKERRKFLKSLEG